MFLCLKDNEDLRNHSKVLKSFGENYRKDTKTAQARLL